jgi:hypothetical protein
MWIDQYLAQLNSLTENKSFQEFLDPDSVNPLYESVEKLRGVIEKEKKLNKTRKEKKVEWMFGIPRSSPLRFKIGKNDPELKLRVDISCSIQGIEELQEKVFSIKKYNFEVRVWSEDENVIIRDDFDSEEIRKKIMESGCRRVMSRFHFDVKSSNTKRHLEPFSHFHIGGESEDQEFCWLHNKIKIPRFPHPPMDLILLSELILASFFHDESEELRNDPFWKDMIRFSQDCFLKPYFTECNHVINNFDKDHSTLLNHMHTINRCGIIKIH